LDARLMTLLCKKILVVKSKEAKTRCSVVESSKKGCGSKRAVLPMMMMIMMTMMTMMMICESSRSIYLFQA
jgi:hypothetical protein